MLSDETSLDPNLPISLAGKLQCKGRLGPLSAQERRATPEARRTQSPFTRQVRPYTPTPTFDPQPLVIGGQFHQEGGQIHLTAGRNHQLDARYRPILVDHRRQITVGLRRPFGRRRKVADHLPLVLDVLLPLVLDDHPRRTDDDGHRQAYSQVTKTLGKASG